MDSLPKPRPVRRTLEPGSAVSHEDGPLGVFVPPSARGGVVNGRGQTRLEMGPLLWNRTEQEQAVSSELGLPPDAWMVFTSGRLRGPQRQEYMFKLWGVALGETGEAAEGPVILSVFDAGDGSTFVVPIQVWGIRLGHRGSETTAELRWHPERGFRYALTRQGEPPRDDDYRWAGRCFKLLQGVIDTGRTPLMSDDEFRLLLTRELDRHPASKHPKKGEVASALGLHRETFDTYLRRLGIDWQQARLDRLNRQKLGDA